MADSQYFLTYDFRLIYQSTAILKEFDDVSGVFKTLDIYLDLDTKHTHFQNMEWSKSLIVCTENQLDWNYLQKR